MSRDVDDQPEGLVNQSGHCTLSAAYLGGSCEKDDEEQDVSIAGSLLRSESQDDSTCGGGDLGDSGSEDFSDSERHHRPHKSQRDHRMEPYNELTDVQVSCLNFAMEHRIFLRAILGLLAERDKKATEIGMNDPNTLKSGPLK